MEGRPAKRRRKGEACGSLKGEQLGDGIRENSTAKHSTRSSSQNAFYLSELNEGWSGLHSHPRFEKRLQHLDDCQSPLPLPPMSPWSSSSSRHDRRNSRSSRRRVRAVVAWVNDQRRQRSAVVITSRNGANQRRGSKERKLKGFRENLCYEIT